MLKHAEIWVGVTVCDWNEIFHERTLETTTHLLRQTNFHGLYREGLEFAILLINVGLDNFLCLFVLFAASLLALFLGVVIASFLVVYYTHKHCSNIHTLLAIRIR